MARSRNSSAAPKLPDADGHFGPYGGRYVAETLMPAILDLEKAWAKLSKDARFRREFQDLLVNYAGRPTRLHFARRLTEILAPQDREAFNRAVQQLTARSAELAAEVAQQGRDGNDET